MKVKRVRLTVGKVAEHVATDGKQSFLWDSEVPGLAVRATPPGARNASGNKAYIFQSRFNNTTLRITIGDCRSWAIDDARTKARNYQTQIDSGRDPRELKAAAREADKAAKNARAAAKADEERRKHFTLKALCEAYCNHLKGKGKTKSARDALSAFKCHVFGTEHAETTAGLVTPHQIAGIVRTVFESGKERTAGVLRNYLVAAYNAARRAPFDPTILSALIDFEITTNPADSVPAIGVNRGERTLTLEELKKYMDALGDTPVDQMLRLHIYAGGQRMAQVTRAKVSDYTSDTGTLRLWDSKGKRRAAREHLIPLAPMGKTILNDLATGKTAENKLFPSERAAGDRIAEIRKNMGGAYFDTRDLRRTCETMLAGMGITKETRAHLLSHGLGGVQDAVYDKHAYTNEKRHALEAWEAKLTEIIEGTPENRNNVTGITKKKKVA